MYNLNVVHCDYWVHSINLDRPQKGEFHTQYVELRQFKDQFFEFYHMSPMQFDFILEKICPYIMKQHTNFREPVSAEEKLLITIM